MRGRRECKIKNFPPFIPPLYSPGTFEWSGAFAGKAVLAGLANMTGGAVLNGASGLVIGYAGGKGNLNTMLQSAGRSVVSGAKTDIATTMLGLGFEAMPRGSGPISFDVEVGWDVSPSGSITQSAHVHAFNMGLSVPRALVTDLVVVAKYVGGNAPQWDELSNRGLYRQIQR